MTKFASLVEKLLDEPTEDGAKTKREAVVELFIENLMDGDRTAWKLFIDRAWPVTNTVELSADVTMRAEMQQAAEELQAMIAGREGRELHERSSEMQS